MATNSGLTAANCKNKFKRKLWTKAGNSTQLAPSTRRSKWSSRCIVRPVAVAVIRTLQLPATCFEIIRDHSATIYRQSPDSIRKGTCQGGGYFSSFSVLKFLPASKPMLVSAISDCHRQCCLRCRERVCMLALSSKVGLADREHASLLNVVSGNPWKMLCKGQICRFKRVLQQSRASS